MNKVFKIVYNSVRGKMMVVNEMTSSMQVGRKKARVAMVVGAALMALGGTASADNPPITITQLPGYNSEWEATSDLFYFNGNPQNTGNNISFDETSFSGNEVVVNSFTAGHTLQQPTKDVTKNSIAISAGTFQEGSYSSDNYIYGGYATTDDAVNNSINITGGSFVNRVLSGGYAEDGDAKENITKITGGSFDKVIVYGGRINGGDKAQYNKTYILETDKPLTGTFMNVYAGFSLYTAEVSHNEIQIDASDVNFSNVIGGYGSGFATAKNNIVQINSGTFSTNVYGAVVNGSGSVIDNEVIIRGGVFGSATQECTISGGNTTSGSAEGNSVTISGGTVTGTVYGGYSQNGSSSENQITISGGIVNGVIVGGLSYDGSGDVTENVINLISGTISGQVIAGFSYSGTVFNNTVNVAGDVDLSSAWLVGDFSGLTGTNTLNIDYDWDDEVKKIKSIYGFGHINFKSLEWVKDGTAVVVDELSLFGNNYSEVSVGVDYIYVDSGGIAAGDSMKLIAAKTIDGELDEDHSSKTVTVKINEGIATTHEGVSCDIDLTGTRDDQGVINNGAVVLTINENLDVIQSSMNEQILVLGESRAAATAFTNQATDLIDSTLDDLGQKATLGMAGFAAIHGNASEYETGSHVDVNGWSMIVGASSKLENGTAVGAFFETGTGNYRTFNDLDGVTMRGDGASTYWGGGLMARHTFDNGYYAEGSVRVGKLENELKNAVKGSQGLTGYDIDTLYFGAHVGAGKVFELNSAGDNVDVYTKFHYTYNEGKNFAIDGDSVNYSSVTSERLRLGARYTKNVSDKLQAKVGAAWEYDFDGDSKNTVANYDLGTPSLGGSTFMADVGVRYQAAKNVSVDFSGRAFTGKREGVAGQFNVKYMF